MNPVIILGIIALLAFALGFLDVREDINWGYVGLGAIAALFMLILVKPGLVERAQERLQKVISGR